jgi:hypothetical protein
LAEHEGQAVADGGGEVLEDSLGSQAVGALEVAVLDQDERRIDGAADVVDLRIDWVGEVLDRRSQAGAGAAFGDAFDEPKRAPRERGGPAAARMPSLASVSCSPSSEMSATRRDTLNPIPATVAAPTICAHGTVSGRPPARRASQLAPLIPTTFPTTRPVTIPSVIRDVAACRSWSVLSSTPVLASAKRGTTTKLVQGWNRCWSRSLGETARATVRLAVRASFR